MDITLLIIVIPLLFLLLIMPLFLRYIIGHVIYFLLKKRYMTKSIYHSLGEENDSDAIEKVRLILLKKLRSPFLHTFDMKNEVLSIILAVQNCYLDEEKDNLQFTFSVSDLIKTYFLFMSDINQILKKTWWLKSLRKSKVSTLIRISRISGYYNKLYKKIPFLKILRKGKITGKIIRILLIPILGIPSVFISIMISLISIFSTEIIWKYYYSIVLYKCAYYSILLYGDKKTLIKEQVVKFPSDKIKKMAAKVEDIINPENHLFQSDYFEDAFLEFQKALDKFEISPEKDLNISGVKYKFNKKRKLFKKAVNIPINVAKQYNPFYKKSYSDRDQILQMIKAIASVYSSQDNYYEELRILDLFEIFYMISVLFYSKLLFGSKILDYITVDFLFKAKDLNDEIVHEILKNKIPIYRQVYRSLQLIRKSRIIYKAVRSTNPVAFFFTFTGPMAFEGVKSEIRDYIYLRAGRFAIYCFESNKLNRDSIFFIPDEF